MRLTKNRTAIILALITALTNTSTAMITLWASSGNEARLDVMAAKELATANLELGALRAENASLQRRLGWLRKRLEQYRRRYQADAPPLAAAKREMFDSALEAAGGVEEVVRRAIR